MARPVDADAALTVARDLVLDASRTRPVADVLRLRAAITAQLERLRAALAAGATPLVRDLPPDVFANPTGG